MSQDDVTIPDQFVDHDQYRRVVKRMKTDGKNIVETSQQYLHKIDEDFSREMADLKAKIDQVGLEIEPKGQQLLEEFRHHVAEYEDQLKNESGNLNKLYHDLCNYKTSHDEIYGDNFRKFQAEKQNFMARLVELRKKESDKLATIHDQVEQLNDNIKRKIMVFDDSRTLVTLQASKSNEEKNQASMSVEEGSQDHTTTTTTAS